MNSRLKQSKLPETETQVFIKTCTQVPMAETYNACCCSFFRTHIYNHSIRL